MTLILDGLMDHQKNGASWLLDNPRGMLAWEMGVGKTAAAARAWENSCEAGPLLVLCLASARENWRREIVRRCIDTDLPPRVHVVTNAKAPLDPSADVVVANYDKLLNKHFTIELRKKHWGAIILDEAHVLKTPTCHRTRAVYGGGHHLQVPLIKNAERVWPLTGTPMPSHPAELWTHAYYLWPDAIKYRDNRPMELWEFELGFCQIKQNKHGYSVVGGKNLAELKERLSPHISRLKRADVLDLPPLRIDTWPLDMETTSGLRGHYPDLPDLMSKLTARFGSVSEVDKFSIDTLNVYLACIEAEFTQLATLRRETGNLKAIATAMMVREELEQGAPKTVIFAHHREAIEALAKGLKEYKPAIVHGGVTSGGARDAEIDRFNTAPDCRVFIGQLQAAGSSINLQAGKNVVFAEHSWVPGENEQALSRVYRAGQTDPVLVRFVYLAGVIDEAITRALARKVAMISQVIN